MSPDLGEVVERQYSPIIRAIRTLEKPVVCAVNGVAAGAGANIAFACDLVLAAEDATFIQSFAKIGLIPDSGGTFILPRLVGYQRAAALAMLGEKLDAGTAKQWGLVYDVVPPTVLARHELRSSPSASPRCRHARSASSSADSMRELHNDLDTQLALEAELQREAGRTDDYAEGVRAFVEKRKPKFQGR